MRRVGTSATREEESDDDGMSSRAHTEGFIDEFPASHRAVNYDVHLLKSDGYIERPLDSYRRRVLKEPFASPESQSLFRMSFDEWKRAERSLLPGWKCSVSSPYTLKELQPYAEEDLHLLDKISIVRAGVTELELDAIVNAANESCLGGGGVDGAVHSAAGPLLLRECATFNGCETGHTRMTKGYNLPAKFVLHTVGPVGKKPALLSSCYRSCLQLAKYHGLRSVGFCCVSTGIFGYPLRDATLVALTETFSYLKEHRDAFDMLCFACFTQNEYDVYNELAQTVYHKVMTSNVVAANPASETPPTSDANV